MKPHILPIENARVMAWTSVATLLLAVGCTTPLFRGQSPDPEPAAEFAEVEEARERERRDERELVGDLATPIGLNYIPVESVALVTRLQGTGSDPVPSPHRDALIKDMQSHNVRNVSALLASPNTSLVLVRGFLPPGVQKNDQFDVEVRVPERSETSSVRGGWLMQTRLREYQVFNNRLHEGHVNGLAAGPVLIDAVFDHSAGKAAEVRGRVLGGGVSLHSRLLGLAIHTDHSSIRTSALIASSVNARFYVPDGSSKVGAAKAKDDNSIDLAIDPRYRYNIGRYVQVVRSIAVGESPAQQNDRLQKLQLRLLEPTTAGVAAMQLEAIGRPAMAMLKKGLASEDAEVRFYSAEALAYLDDVAATRPLVEAIRNERSFRWRALTALAAINDPRALDGLSELMDAPSAETRYGAFRALRLRTPDGPLVRGEQVGDEFWLHVIPSRAEPMVHFARSRSREIVLFGHEQRLSGVEFLYAGSKILLKGIGPEQIRISRFGAGEADAQETCSTAVVDVVRTIARLGGGYAEVLECLMSARQKGYLVSRVEIDALPRPGREQERDALGDTTLPTARNRFRVPQAVPDIFVDQLSEEETRSQMEEEMDILPEEEAKSRNFFQKLWPFSGN